MFCYETGMVLFDRALTYLDALSVLAVLLIISFVAYISIRQRKKNK
ncbi:MAG: hypothetical protein IKK26_03020 [Clostridia bacterium]|nr:hypothetical protein [Clostridia bacterium]MBR6650690.1 hypothetical protein [Clostridia bacterium]